MHTATDASGRPEKWLVALIWESSSAFGRTPLSGALGCITSERPGDSGIAFWPWRLPI
jgi:hypothetical protein